MGIAKNLAHRAEAAKGAMKKNFGRATRNRTLQGGGSFSQAKGNTKLSGVKLKNTLLSPNRTTSRMELIMIAFGVILLIAGYVFGIPLVTTLGLILLVVGVVLFLMGSMGRPAFGRRHYF